MSDIRQKALELCWEIEKLPASEQQTKISIMASDLLAAITKQDEYLEGTLAAIFAKATGRTLLFDGEKVIGITE
jgi:hypothetical protein